MKKQQFITTINAPAQKVRNVMLSDHSYRERTQAFNPAWWSWFEGDWSAWSIIKFIGVDPEHPDKVGGMRSKILESVPGDHVYIEHQGEIRDGQLIESSDRAGAREDYLFSENNGVTTLTVHIDLTDDEFVAYMAETWPKALATLKSLCEQSAPQLTVSTKVYAPLQKVRDAWTNPEDVMQRNHASDDRWCPAARTDLRVWWLFSATMAARDGSFSFDFTGQYDVVEPMSRLSYTMGAFDKHFVSAWRKCIVTFVEDGSCGCVTVTETFDAEEIHALEMQQQWRQAILENFKKHVEGK